MRTLKSKGGFTLVELIVVIAILAILAGVAIPVYNGYITKAQDAAAVTELDAIATAAQAANATAGSITKITVNNSADTIKIEAGAFSEDYASDFVLFYPTATGGTADPATDPTSFTFSADLNEALDGTSYNYTATWNGEKWEGVKTAPTNP